MPSYDITGPIGMTDTDEDAEPLSTAEVELIEEESHFTGESELLEPPEEDLEALREDEPEDDGDPPEGEKTR
jgi:hypothetical protein